LVAPSGGATLQIDWQRSLPGSASLVPSLTEQTVMAAGRDGTVVAWDLASGAERWRVKAPTELVAGVGAGSDVAVVGGRNGVLYAYATGGRTAWSARVGAELVSQPLVREGMVFVRGSDNRVTAFELASGQRRWSFVRQGPALVLRQMTALAADRESVYVGLPGGRLVALALTSGALRWEAAVASPRGSNEIERIADIVGAPVLAGGEVCASAYQGRVGCFEASSGRVSWARELNASGGTDVDARLLVACDDKGHVHAFARSGASLWRQEQLAGRVLCGPALSPAHVVVGDAQGLLHVLSRDDGVVQARLSLDGSAITAAPRVRGKRIVVQTQAGTLAALTLQ
jgi:outer membrane protein assembly factor BamB